METGVKSDRGGERMDSGTGSAEMKTLVKKPANTIKAIRYTASSADKDKMSWCSFHMHLMVVAHLKISPSTQIYLF